MPQAARETDRAAALRALAHDHGVPGRLNADQLWWLGELAPFLGDVPPRMHGGLIRYLAVGVPPGSFLTALVENDLVAALAAADDENLALLPVWMRLLHFGVLGNAYGSAEKVRVWTIHRGLAGPEPRPATPATVATDRRGVEPVRRRPGAPS